MTEYLNGIVVGTKEQIEALETVDASTLYVLTDDTTYASTESVDSKISAVKATEEMARTAGDSSTLTLAKEYADSIKPTKISQLENDSNLPVDANYIHTDNNFTTDEKTKLSGIESGAQVNPDLTSYAKTVDVNTALSGKADTTHNHTLSGLSEKSYNSLTDKPTIPTQYTDAMAQNALSAQLATKVDKNGTQTLTDNNLTNELKTAYDGAVTKSNIIFANTSGTNTGDETNSTIKTKLGTDLSNKYDSSNFVAGTNYVAPDATGGWTLGYTALASNLTWNSATNYGYDMASILPTSTDTYECVFQVSCASASGASGNTHLMYGNSANTGSPVLTNASGAPAGGTITVPVAGRIVKIYNYGAQQNNCYLALRGYRKYKV